MSEFIKQFKGFVAKNPEFKAILQGLAKDGHAVATMPTKIAGEIRRGYGQAVEDVADFAGGVAGKVAEYAPRVQVGSEDSPITIDTPLRTAAKAAEGVAGVIETGGELLSDYETPAEQRRESAQAAMDRRIQETMGQGLPSQREIFLKRKAEVEARKGKAGAEPEAVEVSDLTAEEYEESPDFVGPPEPEEAAMPTVDPKLKKRLDKGAKKQARQAKRAAKQAPEDEGVDVSGAAKAVPVAPDDQAEALFETVHGGSFDPNSSMDRGKLEAIKKNLVRDEYKGLTPNQFALKMYREAA